MTTALIPLNKFINVAKKITTDPQIVYTTPTEVSAIILSAICSNRTAGEVTVNVKLRKYTKLIGSTNTTFEDFSVSPDIPIPGNDVLAVVTSRLVLTNLVLDGAEIYDALIVSSDTNDAVDLIMSINEAANE